jgi:hypothetical protein
VSPQPIKSIHAGVTGQHHCQQNPWSSGKGRHDPSPSPLVFESNKYFRHHGLIIVVSIIPDRADSPSPLLFLTFE